MSNREGFGLLLFRLPLLEAVHRDVTPDTCSSYIVYEHTWHSSTCKCAYVRRLYTGRYTDTLGTVRRHSPYVVPVVHVYVRACVSTVVHVVL
jgi:hypothetical protein